MPKPVIYNKHQKIDIYLFGGIPPATDELKLANLEYEDDGCSADIVDKFQNKVGNAVNYMDGNGWKVMFLSVDDNE